MSSNIDMLVKLYNLPPLEPLHEKMLSHNIIIRRPRAYEKSLILEWVEKNFSRGWASECDVCFSHFPISAYIATQGGNLIGFSCFESTYRNFFGPIGVLDRFQGINLGSALLLTSLYAMHDMGYAYAIIGGPTTAVGFYNRSVGATAIEGSSPGIYIDRLLGSDS